VHKDDLEYSEVDLGEGKDYVVRREGRDLVVVGRCGRCDIGSKFRISDGVVLGGSGKGLRKDAVRQPQLATIYCSCGKSHQGRPAGSDEDGCGAFWNVEV
jgi:hypothetical protein